MLGKNQVGSYGGNQKTPKYENNPNISNNSFFKKQRGNLSLSIDQSSRQRNKSKKRNVSYNYENRKGAPYFPESPMEENSKEYKISKWDRPKKRGNSSKSKDSRSLPREKVKNIRKSRQMKIGNVKLRSQLHAYVDNGKSNDGDSGR